MQIDPGSLGGFLRQERERQGVTLQDISAVTKIQLRFLEALEQNDHAQLPPTPLYVIGFLRAYAQALDLDVRAILAAYHASAYEAVTSKTPPSPLAAFPYHSRRKRLTSLIGLMVLLAAVLWLLRTENNQLSPSRNMDMSRTLAPSGPLTTIAPDSTPLSAPVLPNQPVMVDKPDAALLQPSTQLLAPPKPVLSSHTEEPLPVRMAVPETLPVAVQEPPVQTAEAIRSPVPERLVLQAKALQETWLRVRIDGKTPDDILLTSGKSVSWEANEQFLLTIGNVQGTRLTLNGQEIPLSSDRSNVIRDFLLTRQLLHPDIR